MPQRWNDDKIDALSDKVDGLELRTENGFNQLDARIAKVEQSLRTEMGEMRTEVKDMRSEMTARFDRLLHWLLGSAAAIIVALLTAHL